VTELILAAIVALVVGALIGWLVASRRGAALASELAVATSRAADFDIVRQARDAVERERNDAVRDLAAVRAQHGSVAALADQLRAELAAVGAERNVAHRDLATLKAQADGFEARLIELREAKDVMAAQFGEVANRLLGDAQKAFLERADHRFRQSEETAGQNLKALLQPVNDRLQRYEEGVHKIEAERRDVFGELRGQIDAMRQGQERVSSEAARLVNALRNAPKARGRWGEQQLRNVLESCGLAEHTDFMVEVSMTLEDGARLRPDAIVRVPGGKSLVIDAKVSLNAYQDAFNAIDDTDRLTGLTAHAASMRAHVNGLGNKAYWSQFDDAPEYVVMFVPGEHFLSAALEHDPTLWDFAFEKRVLLATPTNLIAIARTVSAVWRQEKLANQAREIAALGKELYARLATMGTHVSKLGKNLDTAMGAYNAFVGSLESQVLTSARRFEALNVETGGKAIESPPVLEQAPRPLTKLAALPEAAE
jgi:DNA recombination protein RmuC